MYLYIILLLNMGLAAGEMEPFIVGGDYVDIKQFPHSIYLYVDCITTFICGGSILNSHVILTAGHCLYECKKNSGHTILINYGDASINRMKSVLASQHLVHDKYDEKEVINDIGLMYTSVPIPFGEGVQRVAILSRFPTRATGGYVTGWGVINSVMDMASTMKYVYQELRNNKMCEDLIDLPQGTFCAQSKHRDNYPDQGDSGGAFIVYNFVQIGIVSYKYVDHDIIAYTNVTYFYKWIKDTAIKLSCGTF